MKKVEQDKLNFVLLSIVAIVAIVGLVVLFSGTGKTDHVAKRSIDLRADTCTIMCQNYQDEGAKEHCCYSKATTLRYDESFSKQDCLDYCTGS